MITKRSANQYLNKRSGSLERRGVVTECCRKSCSLSDMESYCAAPAYDYIYNPIGAPIVSWLSFEESLTSTICWWFKITMFKCWISFEDSLITTIIISADVLKFTIAITKCWILLKPVLGGVDGSFVFSTTVHEQAQLYRACNICNFVVLDFLKWF